MKENGKEYITTDNSVMAQMKSRTKERIAKIVLLLLGLVLISFGFYLRASSRMGSTMYIMGIWSASVGILRGTRDRYVIVLMGIGVVLMLGYQYPFVFESGLGILLGAFNALFHSINNAKRKIRLAPPKPPFMAICSVR